MFFLEVRIISPTGRLLTVNRAVPIVETIFDFNGESRFLGDICRNGTKPMVLPFCMTAQAYLKITYQSWLLVIYSLM